MIWIGNGKGYLMQWERGAVVMLSDKGDEVRLSREDDQTAYRPAVVRSGRGYRIEIPDRMLTESGYLYVSIIDRASDGERIREKARFVIRAAQRPKDYVYGSGETASWQALRLRMEALERAAREGKFDGKPGESYILTDADKKEIASLIEVDVDSVPPEVYIGSDEPAGDEVLWVDLDDNSGAMPRLKYRHPTTGQWVYLPGGSPGATFTPSVSEDGVLSWTNDGDLDNPASVNIKGPQGDPGQTGDNGDPGEPGATFTPSVSEDGVLSWTNDGGLDNPASVNIKGPQGDPGQPGVKGDPGATFTPSVSEDGVLSWTNDGDLDNPASVNIKGPQGDPGQPGVKGDKGDPGDGYILTDEDKQEIADLIEVPDGGGGESVDEVYVGESAPTDPNVKIWVDPTEQPDESGVTCSSLGMIEDGDAAENFALLSAAMQEGARITVDGYYSLAASATAVIDGNIALYGQTPDCGFDLSSSSDALFEPGDGCAQIDVVGLTLKKTTSGTGMLIHKAELSGTRMRHIRFCGNRVEGYVSPIRITQSTEVDPSTDAVGVDTIQINRNRFYNQRVSAFVLNNVTFDRCEVIGNNIRNFDFVFLTVATTNEATFSSEITKAKKLIVVEDNDVYCTDVDDPEGAFLHTSESGGAYYNFILAEGMRCIYRDNRIEGMKSTVKTALYDAYLSCADVVYEGNTWKNNVILNTTEGNHVNHNLIKAKGNAGGVGTRRYHNNTWIIEADYYTKHGYDAATSCFVVMANSTSESAYDIQHNSFDVARMGGFTSSSHIKRMVFSHNTVKVGTWISGGILAGIGGAEVFCEYNDIACTDGKNYEGFMTVGYTAARAVFRGNRFQNCRYPLGAGKAADAIIDNNTVFDNMSSQAMFSGAGHYGTITGQGNRVIKSGNSCSLFGGNVTGKADLSAELITSEQINACNVFMFDGLTNSAIRIDFEGITVGDSDPFHAFVYFAISDGYIMYTTADNTYVQQIEGANKYVTLKPYIVAGALPFDIMLYVDRAGYVGRVDMQAAAAQRVDVKVTVKTEPGDFFIIPEAADIPAEYQRLQYITSSGTQYIDTGVNAVDYTDGINYDTQFEITGFDSSVTTFLFGCVVGSGTSAKRSANIGLNATNMSVTCGGNNNQLMTISYAQNTLLDFKMYADPNDPSTLTWTINGVSATKTGLASAASTFPDRTITFLRNHTSTYPSCAIAKVYRLKMSHADGTPIRDFVHCYRISDGVVGVFDTVEQTFYVNAGSGEFGKGFEV